MPHSFYGRRRHNYGLPHPATLRLTSAINGSSPMVGVAVHNCMPLWAPHVMHVRGLRACMSS